MRILNHLKVVDVNCERIYFDFESQLFSSFVLKNPDVEVFNGDLEFFLYLLFPNICLLFTLLSSLMESDCSMGSIVS
jgi:hypothetical protein